MRAGLLLCLLLAGCTASRYGTPLQTYEYLRAAGVSHPSATTASPAAQPGHRK